jgi:hypothetical protein
VDRCGLSSTVSFHLSMVDDESMGEWTWDAVPSVSFVNGYNPQYTRYLEFDRFSAAAPNTYTPLP